MIINSLNTFFIDRRARQLSANSLAFYNTELGLFVKWIEPHGIDMVLDLTPTHLREYLLYLPHLPH